MNVVATMIGANPDETRLKALIRTEMHKVATAASLRSFEIPRDFLVEYEPFSRENGLLSSVQKRMRPSFKRKYGDQLEALYEHIERNRHEDLLALRIPTSSMTVRKKMGKALEASLGIEGIDVNSPLGFRDLGGDSIGAASFTLFLEDIFGVQLPLNAILSPASNPRVWASAIESAVSAELRDMPTFASIHGKGATVGHHKDLDIVRFLDETTLAQIPKEAPRARTRVVLLMGANGFLGRNLCLQWMEKLAPTVGKVICLIRGADPDLERHYHELAAEHLEVLAGDVAEPLRTKRATMGPARR
jgi:fatty acid CoA ligase FadD9